MCISAPASDNSNGMSKESQSSEGASLELMKEEKEDQRRENEMAFDLARTLKTDTPPQKCKVVMHLWDSQ